MTTYKSMNILLADDDEDDRELFAEAISDPTIKLNTATNGKELMQLLDSATALPDCVFIDLNMPEKSGKECLAEIRQNAKFTQLPVIIYSTSSSRKDIDETFALGANLYLVKPGSFKALCEALTKIIQIDWRNTPTAASADDFVYATS